jgi:hypothetical protein
MSTLAGELEKLRALLGTLQTRRILPANQVRPTRRALERVLQTWDVSMQAPKDRVEEARRAILTAQRNGTDLAKLTPRVLRDSVWLLWPEAKDGVKRPALRRAILKEIATNNAILRRLIDAWLLEFDKDDDSFVDVGKQIDRHLAASHSGLLALWKESHKTHDIFNAVSGPDRLASRILEDSSGSILAACRLDVPSRAASGYLRAIHLALSARLPKLLREERALDFFQQATRFYAPDGALRFKSDQAMNGAMADALVAAWIRAPRTPSDRLKKEVLTYLRLHLGDPRVERQSGWARASDETRQKVRGWLSALSLDAFFDLVGRFAGNAGMGHQWEARKAFWKACLKAGHIRDSWLVLGENVARAVSDNAELRGSYGRLHDLDPNRSVLLIQIGDLVFSEWTYNGRLRAWKTDSQHAPRMFRPRYERSEVTGDSLQFHPPQNKPHLSISGTDGITHVRGEEVWQGRTAALLRRREGIVLNPNDWRVR